MIKNYQDRNGFVNVSGIEIFKKRLWSKKKGYRKPMTPFFRYSLSLIITCALFFFLPRKTCLSQDRIRAITSV